MPLEAQRGRRDIAVPMGVVVQCHALAALLLGKSPSTCYIEGFVGSRYRQDGCGEDKISSNSSKLTNQMQQFYKFIT